MTDISKDVKRYRPAVHNDGAACMVDCKMGFWVSKPDYDALSAEVTRLTAELATARDDALEEAARFVHVNQVGVNPRTGYVVAPSNIEGTEGTHAGMAYAAAIRALKGQPHG